MEDRPQEDPHNPGSYHRDDLQTEVFATTIEQIGIHVLREGRFIFDFSESAEYRQPSDDQEFGDRAAVEIKRVELLNTHVLCLHLAIRDQSRLSLDKPVVSPPTFIGYSNLGPNPSYGTIDPRLSPLAFTEYAPYKQDWRFSSRHIVSVATIDLSVQTLQSLLAHPRKNILAITDLHLRASAFYETYDFNLALIASWAIVEAMVRTMWDRYLDTAQDEAPPMTSRRRKRLTGPDYTASVITETLVLLGRLPRDLYVALDSVRTARNRFLHNLTPVPLKAASDALQVAERMVLLVEDLDLALPHGLKLGG